jgi:ERCC4-type nuclease
VDSKVEVVDRALKVGDFAFTSTPHSLVPSAVAVERKTVADLVQRSAKGDHIRQLDVMVQVLEHSFFALEGDPRLASGYTAYGASEHTGATHVLGETDV